MDDPRKEMEELVGKMLPEEREEMKVIVTNLADELMEKTQQVNALQAELKEAVKRKKIKNNPLEGSVDLVMFGRPTHVKDAKIRMMVSDNVQMATAIASVRRLKRDPQHEFYGGFLLPARRKSRDVLEGNAECVWHLFEHLDRAIKAEDSKESEDGE